jgi:hypothetical protein
VHEVRAGGRHHVESLVGARAVHAEEVGAGLTLDDVVAVARPPAIGAATGRERRRVDVVDVEPLGLPRRRRA